MGWLCGGDEEQAQEREQEADHPEPVSYTHLDVYKRQRPHWTLRRAV